MKKEKPVRDRAGFLRMEFVGDGSFGALRLLRMTEGTWRLVLLHVILSKPKARRRIRILFGRMEFVREILGKRCSFSLHSGERMV